MLSLRNADDGTKIGNFKSYAAIGKFLHYRGKPGKYHVLPSNMTNLAAVKDITVTKDKYGKQVEMEGSIF